MNRLFFLRTKPLPPPLRSATLPLRRPRRPLLLLTTTTIVSVPLAAYTYSTYSDWLTLGRGGVPHNFLGWLAQASLHAVSRSDTRAPLPRPYASVSELAALYGPEGASTFLPAASFPERKGGERERPVVPGYVAPQRQRTGGASGAMIARQNAFLRALADANPAVFEMRTSTLEGPLHEGLYLRAPPSPTSPSASSSSSSSSSSEDPQDPQALEAKLRARLGRGTGGGEFAHVHGEGSAHVTLSPGDAATAIRAGWAERHQMSGVGGPKLAMVPWGYVMVYAPREGEEGEWQAWKDVVMAGARYVAQGRGVEVVVPS